MSKRGQETQGGEERYGFSNNGPGDMADRPQQANAAQMARRKIAQVKKAGASARSSRANTPNAAVFSGGANPFQQSMPSFQVPQQGAGDGSGFNFASNVASNPFQNANGASGTPPPAFPMGQQPQQQNGGGGMFGGNTTSFGSNFGSTAPAQPQSNGLSFGANNSTNGNNTPSFGGFGQSNTQNQGQQNGATPNSNTSSFTGFGQTNGTANAPFQFGQPQTQSTQGTSFSSFGAKPQTNGEKPAANSFGGFGQSTQQQQPSDKPATPSFNFGQSAQQPAFKPQNRSLEMGDSGNATQPQTNGDKAPVFGAAPQAEQTPKSNTGSLFTFNSSNKGIGNKASPEPTAKATETAKAPMSNLFGGAQQNIGSNLFGGTPPPRESSATPKPGESIFSTQSKPKLGGNLFTSAMAEGQRPESPAPAFGQQPQQNGVAAPDTDQTPKPSNSIFGGLGQSQSNAVQGTPRPSTSLFSGSSFGQTPAQPATAPKNLFGQSMQDTSMNTPDSTPQKSSLFTPAATQQPAPPAEQSAASETPAPGRSLFDRITRDDETPATAQKDAEKPSSEQPAAALPPTSFGGMQAVPASAQKPLFSPSTNLFNTPAPQPPQSTDLFSKQNEQPAATPAPKAPSLSAEPSTSRHTATPQPGRAASIQNSASSLADAIPDNEKDTFKVLNEGLAAHLANQDPSVDWTTIMEYYLQQAAIIRHKPAPNLTALSAATSTAPTPKQSAERPVAPTSSSAAQDKAPQKTPASLTRPQPSASNDSIPHNIFGGSTAATAATPKAPTPFQRTASSDTQQTPKPSFLQPPSTAPVNRKRSAEDEPQRPPATEKRARPSDSVEYPKLPGNASDVSKMFYNALENKESGASQEKAHDAPAPSGFKPSTGTFKPSTSGFTPSTSGFKPSTSGFTPSAPSSGSNNFMAAFGQRAGEQAKKDYEKRKAEDYDSEEESEEQWAARDKKQQEAKRAKSVENAKASSGFVFKTTPATPKAAEKRTEKVAREDSEQSGQDESSSNDQEQPKENGQGKSLFDRASWPSAVPTTSNKPNLFPSQTPTSKTPKSNIFGSSATPGSTLFGHLAKPAANEPSKAPESAEKGETVEKQTQGTGDNTWTQSTPIKFGAAASTEAASTTPAAPPPAFGNLFGTKAQASSSNNTGLLNVPGTKSAMGFNFGAQPASASASGSRATTPGVTTDGEGNSTAGEDNNEPSDDPPANEAQVEDMTGLSAEETKGETLLFSVAMSKASKWDEKKTDDGGMAHGWVDKGKGPLYLLKNDDTGKVRILLKVPPYGAAKMNFPPLKGGGYEVQGKTGKQITGTFYDHLGEKPGLGKWLVAVGKTEDAEEVSRILREGVAE